ncbi:hypothetical protein OUZ56_003580 [Daphnia magna]|uniref:Uncharacterized protein n=1 Tax=Daphnia magna TaxID=35525 RepID=A0ABR0A9I9_9CRUS|nr:hypothetical protein OUZ56_003580 [Daphnia magna]
MWKAPPPFPSLSEMLNLWSSRRPGYDDTVLQRSSFFLTHNVDNTRTTGKILRHNLVQEETRPHLQHLLYVQCFKKSFHRKTTVFFKRPDQEVEQKEWINQAFGTITKSSTFADWSIQICRKYTNSSIFFEAFD